MAGGGGGAGMGGFNKGGRVRRFSQGGWVPGSGNGDTVPAMLEPGEFVLKKSAAQAFGPSLSGINKYGDGTGSKGVRDPDGMTASSTPVLSKALFQSVHDGDSYRIHGIPSQKKWNTTTRLDGGVDAYEIKAMKASGDPWAQREKELGLLGRDVAKEHAKFKKNQDIIDMFSGVNPKEKEKYGRPMMQDRSLAADLVKQGLGEKGKATGSLKKRIMGYAKGRTRAGINNGKAGKLYKGWVNEERQRLQLEKKAAGYARGGMIDSVPALLTPGEFVVNKKSAQRFGYGGLSRMNKFARGGPVRRYAGGTGSSGVLPLGMGGGMDPMMLIMGMQGLGGQLEQTGKAATGAIQGLTSVAAGAGMAYTKFQFAAQAAGAFGNMAGIGGEKLDYFIQRVGMIGGVLSAAQNLLSSPAAQKAVQKGIGWLEIALMSLGDKIPGMVGKAFKAAGGGKMRSFGKAGFAKSAFSIPGRFKRAGEAGKRATELTAKASKYGGKASEAMKVEQNLLRQRQKIADQMADIAKSRAAKKIEQQAAGKTVGYWTRDAQQQAMGSGARKSSFGRARAAQSQGVFAKKEIAKLDDAYKGLSRNLSKVDDGLKVASKSALKFGTKAKSAAKGAAMMTKLAKGGAKAALGMTGIGLAAIALEETIGLVGRKMTESAMTRIEDSGGKFEAGEEEAIISKAGTGGAISGAAMGAGIGALLAPWTGGLSIAIGAAIGGLWGWYNATVEAEEAIQRAKFGAAVEGMADTMNKWNDGVISDSMALGKLVRDYAAVNNLGSSAGVDLNEIADFQREAQANAESVASAKFAGSYDYEATKGGASMQRALGDGLITQEFIDSQEEVVKKNIETRDAQEAYMRALKATNRELRTLEGISSVFGEVERSMISYADTIESMTGSIKVGKMGRAFEGDAFGSKARQRRSQAYDAFGNIAGEGNAKFVSGSGIGRFADKAKDVDFLERNLEDVLLRSSIGGGLDAESRRDVISKEMKSSLQSEGHTLTPYMEKQIDDITRGLEDEDLTDIEGNMKKITGLYMEGGEEFKNIFKEASEMVDNHNARLAEAYDAQLKLEQEYVTRQKSLMQARFDSEEKFRQNLSASAYSGTSNADIQSNFMAQNNMMITGSGGIGGLSASRQNTLAARGGVGSVDAVGKTFKDISKDLMASNKALKKQGLQDIGQLDPNDPLVAQNKDLIASNKQLQQEYDATKQVLENYANSQARLTALNRELEQAQAKRKTLKELSIQARYGTADEKDSAARLINAITIASQQGIDAVAPELQRQVVGYLPQLMGAQGESIVNQGINDAYGGGKGIAGITEVSAEEKRLATEIKAIEDAGIVAGEHLAEEVGDRVKEMASEIERLQSDFISDLRLLMLEKEEKLAKDDIISAEKKVAAADKDQALLDKYGIKEQSELAAFMQDSGTVLDQIEAQQKTDAAGPGFNIKGAMQGMGAGSNFENVLDTMENMDVGVDQKTGGVASGTGMGGFFDGLDAMQEGGLGGVIEMQKGMAQMAELLGLSAQEIEDMLDEGGGGTGFTGFFGGRANEEVANLQGAERDAYTKAVANLEKQAIAMGMDKNAMKDVQKGFDLAETDAGTVIGEMLRQMSMFQESAGGDDLDKTIDVLKENMGENHPAIAALEAADTPEKRKEILNDIKSMMDIDSVQGVKDRKSEAEKELVAANAHLANVETDMNTLATKGANPGSIYTHDIHLERILLNILSVLEGKGRTVDLKAATAYGSSAGELAKASGLDAKMADKSGAFMSKYGGKSLDEIENMAGGGLIGNDFMTDLDASSLSDEAKQSIKDTIEAVSNDEAGGGIWGMMGKGGGGGVDSSQTLSESMGGDFMKQAVAQAASAITEGSAAANIAAQMMAVIDTSALTDVTDVFSKNIGEFGAAMGSPLNIEVGGSIEVNVNMSGAEFLKDAGGALAEMAGSAASKAINNFIGQMNKSGNVKPNPNGWHESGQPKPLTGNGGQHGPRMV